MSSRRGAVLVGTGILGSRMAGLVRQRVLAHFLGTTDAADALNAAFRIPNLLQNLFGEGVLSASFIPAYARLLGQGREEEARRLAGAVLAALSLVIALLVALGVLATPWLVAMFLPEWDADKQQHTATMVRLLFPATGILVLSAWCLGILNAHRRFLVSYAAPIVWNAAIIAAVLVAGARGEEQIAIAAVLGALIGSVLQVVVQVPQVRRLGGAIRPTRWAAVPESRTVFRTFLPALVSRGAMQISSFIDLALAGFLPAGAVTVMTSAQVLYLLPVSLFGMSVSASELPEMARECADPEQVQARLRIRLDAATQRLAFYIVPSAVAFLALGGVLASAIYQGGAFTASDARWVWTILAGAAVGLLASTWGRLYSSAFYALQDATTPLRCGLIRIGLTAILGVVAALYLPEWLGIDATWGAAGITLAAGFAGWVEFTLLRRALCRRLGRFALPMRELLRLWAAALLAAVPATLVRLAVTEQSPIVTALLVLPVFGLAYLLVTWRLDMPEAAVLVNRLVRRRSGAGR
ncbi:MAG TPA: murein biosynthesis integral membrane protein MurJ [Gemmatimonadales bacterium]|nr:murein biosynthesis integral membrane protein MurJ [Gemmatimonadales bacterium]